MTNVETYNNLYTFFGDKTLYRRINRKPYNSAVSLLPSRVFHTIIVITNDYIHKGLTS